MRSRPQLSILFITLLLVTLWFCGCTSKQAGSPTPDAATLLQAIPGAERAKYERVHDMRNWRNPYLVIRTDGVGLLDAADNAEIILKPDEMLDRLARLPASAWPYGRVVAVAENGVRGSEQDSVAIRRNKGIVGGILQGAHIAIEWVPRN